MKSQEKNEALKEDYKKEPSKSLKKFSLINEKIITFLINKSLYHKTKNQRPKGYCFPLRRTILKNLKERYGIEISMRTLCNHLKFLRDEGYVRVINRTHKGKHGNMVYTSSLYIPTMKAYQRLNATYRDTKVVAFIDRAYSNRNGRINTKPTQKTVQHFKNKPPTPSDLTKEDQGRLFKDMPAEEIRCKFAEAIQNLG